MVQCMRLAVGVMLLMTSLLAIADGNIVVHDAWVREAPPGAPVLAAYFTLENTGSKEDKLVAVHCPDFDKVEIHATEIRDGVARMIALDALPIPPHATSQACARRPSPHAATTTARARGRHECQAGTAL